MASTDQEAAEAIHIAPETAYKWKAKDADFIREYEASFTDGVHVAKSYTRKLLGRAADVLYEALAASEAVAVRVEGCDAGEREIITVPDQRSRLKSVELLFKTHGLLREKVEWTPNLSELSDEELLTLERVLGRIAPTAG